MNHKDETIVINTKQLRKRDITFMDEKKRFPMTIQENKKKYNRKRIHKGGMNDDTI